MSPFGFESERYENWDECISKNRDKHTPEKYCGWIKHQTEDTIPHNCIMKAYIHYKEKYPELTERDWLKKSFDYFENKKINNTTEDFSHDYLYNFNPAEVRLILQGLESLYLNEEEDPYFAETIRNIADQINASSTGLFEENEESAIYLLNLIKEKYGESKTKTGHGWWGETERHSKARKFGKADFDNEDQEKLEDLYITNILEIQKLGLRLFHGDIGDLQYPGKFSWETEFRSDDGDGEDVWFFTVNPYIAKEYGEVYELDLNEIKKKNPNLKIYFDINPNSHELEFVIESDYIWDEWWKKVNEKDYENYVFPIESKDIRELYHTLQGKGKGWWGESERHSKARKTGHADLIGNIYDLIEDLRPKYYCQKCKSNHYLDSDIGREHLIFTKRAQAFKFSEIVNDKTMPKFKAIKQYIDENDDINVEFAFGIDKYGNTTGKYDTSLVIGQENSIKAFSEVYNELRDSTKYIIHSHPTLVDKGENDFGRHFSPQDLINSTLPWRKMGEGSYTNGLVYREYSREKYGEHIGGYKEYVSYYIKVALNIPEDRMQLINEYNKIFDEYHENVNKWDNKWNPTHDPFFFMNQSYEESNKSNEELGKIKDNTFSKIRTFENKYGFKIKRLFKHKFKRRRADFTEDQTIGSKITGPEKTRLQEQFERLKTLETLRKQNIIPAPYQMVNTETGAVLTGQVLYNLDKNTKQLTPVSSTNVKAIGQFNNQLLAQFHAKGAGGFTHTYRYEFESPEQAEEAYNSIMNSGSPGRWIWHNLRGHAKGEPTGIQNVPEKYGPAITNPNLKVIGGTSASLVDYNISNRTPVSRMINFEKINKQLKRRRANIATDPSTGSRVEGILGARKGLRNLRTSGWRAGQHGLPKLDFDGVGVFLGNMYDLIEDYSVKGHYRTTKSGKRIWIRRHTRGEGISIKDKPRMRPLYEWEIRENYQRQLAKLFGKEEYSQEIEMEGKQDYFGKDFHETISIADNVNYKRIDLSIGLANNALKKLPKPFQLDFLDITFYSKITDDPNFESNPKDIPAPYRKVGWNSTYEDVSAQISYKHAKIRIKTSGQDYDHASSMRHEMGHAVWWWVIRGADKQRFNEIYENKKWELKRQGETGEYQANDISEFFAVQFENYYSGFYGAMFPETKSYFDYINKKYGGENKV